VVGQLFGEWLVLVEFEWLMVVGGPVGPVGRLVVGWSVESVGRLSVGPVGR
jgi:hypothetical protein